MVSALLSGDPENQDLPMRRLGMAIFGSAMLAVIIFAVVAVYGVYNPGGGSLSDQKSNVFYGYYTVAGFKVGAALNSSKVENGTTGASQFEQPIDAARRGLEIARQAGVTTILNPAPAAPADDGPYGSEGFVRQALAPLPEFSGNYPVLGSWIVGEVPCGLSIREDDNPITGNMSRFVPHAIL